MAASVVASGSVRGYDAAERVDLDRVARVLEVVSELGDELQRHDRVVVLVDRAHHFFGVACCPDIAIGIAGFEQAQRSAAALLLETLVGPGE